MTDPVDVLLAESDPMLRARAHVTLGTKALDRHDFEVARDHLREAADLDPTDEMPKRLLEQVRSHTRPKRRWLPWLS